ncbi:hypothetical protein N7507_006529 [Penicillium longicatenatum]|nr:hypothetical protein N7507_006529 [Penicillium longicatenatum]
MSSSLASEDLLSIRTSCDRCRSQKLKCLVKPSPGTAITAISCERCVRAMVPCTFSRRNRHKRKASASEEKERTNKAVAVLNPDGHARPTSLPHPACLNNQPPLPMGPDSITIAGYMKTPEEEIFDLEFGWNQEPAQGVLDLSGPSNILERPRRTDKPIKSVFEAHGFMQDENILSNNITGQENDDPHRGRQEISPAASESHDIQLYSNDLPNFAEGTMTSRRTTSARMLLALASDLYERLETLETGPWQFNEAYPSLDAYPIGAILNLSRQLTMATNALHRDKAEDSSSISSQACSTNGHENGYRRLDCESSRFIPTTMSTDTAFGDSSTTHILLGCYITLSQIHFLVLDHFKRYLSLQPNARAWVPSAGGKIGPTICVGELPSMNDMYSRIHTAVFLLLNCFSEVEEALGLPPQIRSANGHELSGRNTADRGTIDDPLAFRSTSWGHMVCATEIQEEFAAFGRKVVEIKNLLREKLEL